MRPPKKYIIRKEILDSNGRFIAYKYYFRTINNVPEWVDEQSSAMRFNGKETAQNAIENMRFLVVARMSVKEV